MRAAFADEYSSFIYSRGKNPTVDILRKKLAAIEGAEDCLVLNSGSAAIFAAVLANVKSGDHIISVKEPYSWAKKMFTEILPRFGVSTTFVDGRDTANFREAATENTALIYLESPNSWDYAIQNLASVATFAKEKNIVTICDNSYCTGIYQQPIAMGIDMTIQSATKYIAGHSDVVAGVLCGSNKMIERIFKSEYNNIGSGIQPFNAWLLLRGLRTMPMRLERISATSEKVCAFLKQHAQVEEVLFPFDPEFPQYELAKKQMSGACGLMTFTLKADTAEQVERFCESLQHILLAVSWGSYESLIIPRMAGIPRVEFDAVNKEHRMIRLYVGIEEPAYIIEDLARSFTMIA